MSPARPHMSPLLRGAIIERYGRVCQYCKGAGTLLQGPDGRSWCVDHVVPVGRGGSNDEENLTLACTTCNARKCMALPGEPWKYPARNRKSGAPIADPIMDRERRLATAIRRVDQCRDFNSVCGWVLFRYVANALGVGADVLPRAILAGDVPAKNSRRYGTQLALDLGGIIKLAASRYDVTEQEIRSGIARAV